MNNKFYKEEMFIQLGKDEQEILDNFDQIVQSIKPLSSKQLYQLGENIKELSHQLTDERTSRHISYMNANVQLSAYVRYFMWWNLFRLTHLFKGFPEDAFSSLEDNSYCLDLGSGPLTVVTALFLARPELRSKKLVWYCLDLSQNSLSFGEEIFLSICARLKCEPWKIIRVKGEFGTKINNKAKLLTCANMFNELYYDSSMTLEEAAKKYTSSLLNYTDEDSKLLIIEPAFPRSSRFISLTRDSLLRKNFSIISPCPHSKKCPMDGKRGGKWCHFVLDTKSAPKKLHDISKKAGLTKDRATLSFVFASSKKIEEKCENLFRVSSDEFALPGNRFARYSCNQEGLSLLVGFKNINSGDMVSVNLNDKSIKTNQIDRKTGAKIIELNC